MRPPSPKLRRGLAVALRAEAEGSGQRHPAGSALPQPLCDTRAIKRWRNEIALRAVAAEFREALERNLVLHSLGDARQPQIVRELDRRLDNHFVAVFNHVVDERFVDL